MPNPTLWFCKFCGRALGEIVADQLEPLRRSQTVPGGLLVFCPCGKTRRWREPSLLNVREA